MRLHLQWADGRVTIEDHPIQFRTSGNGRRASEKNPWPVDGIGKWPDMLPGKWDVIGDAKPVGLLVRQSTPTTDAAGE